MAKKILFVVSSADKIGPNDRKTGNFLPEVAHPYETFVRNNYEVDIVSLKGGAAPVDGIDKRDDDMNIAFLDGEGLKKMNSTSKLQDIDTADYDALFVPGGLGPMADMPENEVLQQTIARMYERGAVVGAVCHGPVALLNARLSDGTSLVNNKKVTSFSNEEEENYAKADVPFLLETALKEKGALYTSAEPWQKHVITDGILVTGQNPASAAGVAEEMIKLLEA